MENEEAMGAGGIGGAMQQPAPPDDQDPGIPTETEQATPEEQAEYGRFVGKAFELMYKNRNVTIALIKSLRGAGDPVQGLADTASSVVLRVATAAEKAGQKVNPEVLLHAGTEIFEELADMSRLAKIKDFSQDRQAWEGAYYRALDQVRVTLQQAGRIDQGKAQKSLSKIEEMDRNGDLEKMLRTLDEEDSATRGEEGGEPMEDEPKQPGGIGAAAGLQMELN